MMSLMTGDLSGRVVAVTGASSGIGEATALACARAGATVALAARRADRIARVAAQVEAEGGRALALPVDVADEIQARAFVERTHAALGRLDALVNNAGVMLLGRIAGASTADWRQMIDVNVYGVLYCTHAALPIMREQGSGHVIAISSTAGRIAGAGSGVYSLTKFGIGAFCEALRQETVRDGIRVTLIEPGSVETELLGHNPETVQASVLKRLEDVERLKAEDIADAIVYALSLPAHVAVNEILVRPARQP